LRGGRRAEIVLRAFDIAVVNRVVLRLRAGTAGDEVEARLGGATAVASLGPGQAAEVVLEAGRGFRYYDTYLQILQLRSRRPEAGEAGAFVELRLQVGPEAPAAR
jgi:hypothetical protein